MSDLTWGSILLLIGLTLILKAVFGVSIPIIRILLGIFFIYLGMQVITDGGIKNFQKKQSVIFSQRTLYGTNTAHHTYNTIFGQSVIDLSSLEVPAHPTEIRVNIICSDGTLIINPNIPTTIVLSTVIGETDVPLEKVYWVGKNTYKTVSDSSDTLLTIHCNVICAHFAIKNK